MLGRRQFLAAGTAVVASLTTPFIRPTRAATGRALRLGYILPVQSQLGAGATMLADELAKRTAGRFTLPHFPDATLGGDVELMKSGQLGSIDLAFVTGMGLSTVLPEAGVPDDGRGRRAPRLRPSGRPGGTFARRS